MSGAHRSPKTITVRWRSVAAVVPAAVLAATGIALANSGLPTLADRGVVPQVPQDAITQPDRLGASVVPADSGPAGADPQLAPGLALPAGTTPLSEQPVQLDTLGIPARALSAYHLAARLVSAADPACGIDWALVAAIGRVESDHGRFGGNLLDSGGVARPGIIGIPLDGRSGTARISDTDGGRWDRDRVYDRAVGPMQFIPGTWRMVGSDANGDGQRDPQNIDDAATATAVYLCSGPGDLRQGTDLYRAIRRYNNSDSYVRTVVAIADAYRRGVRALPASSLPAAHQGGSGGSMVQAVGAAPGARPPARTSAASAGSSSGSSGGSAAAGPGDGASGPAGGGAGTQPSSGPTSASVPAAGSPLGSVSAAASSAASSAAAPVTSVVTSIVTMLVSLPVPIITTTTPCTTTLLGVKVCTPTTITATPTTSTVTRTITRAP